MCLLDSWCGNGSTLCRLLPDDQYLDEEAFFGKIVDKGANLSYTDLVQFLAYAQFIIEQQGRIDTRAFQEWMRVVKNLAMNSAYNRPADFQRSVHGVAGLMEQSGDILTYFAQAEKPATGFSELQIAEEKLKAQLILAHAGWRELVDRAECHGYFRGQIGFLLDFADIAAKSAQLEPDSWDASEHVTLLDFADIAAKSAQLEPDSWDASEHVTFQEAFLKYMQLSEAMFSANGLNKSDTHLWQRAFSVSVTTFFRAVATALFWSIP